MTGSPGLPPLRMRSSRSGSSQFRVRAHGTVARIEVGSDELDEAWGMREQIARAVRDAGFAYAAFDLDGYRSGSMNEVLLADERETVSD